jgi:hypothetical protein
VPTVQNYKDRHDPYTGAAPEARDLVNDTFKDVFDAFAHAGAATRLGWPVVFVGRCESIERWLVWVAFPSSMSPDDAREAIEAEKAKDVG